MTTKVVSLDKFSDELKSYSKKNIHLYRKSVIDALLKNLITLVKNSPIDTGLYAQSWDLIINEKEAILGNYAPHAPIIEFGSRPFTPPMKPLLEWARRVLQRADYDQNVWALATYTRNKISENGMQPRHVLTNSLDTIVNDIRMNIKKAFE